MSANCGSENQAAVADARWIKARIRQRLKEKASDLSGPVKQALIELVKSLDKYAGDRDDGDQIPQSVKQRKTPLTELIRQLERREWPQAPQSQSMTIAEQLRRQEHDLRQHLNETDTQSQDEIETAAETLEEPAALRQLRESWLKQHFEQRVQQAIDDGPESPGPLNPEMLIIRALSEMRELSPEYLYRYIEFLDTALWLESSGVSPSRK